MNEEEAREIFDRVLYVGPSLKGKGGISSVLAAYSHFCHPFHFCPTNHPGGTLAGIPVLASAFLKIAFERVRGRQILHIHHACGKSWTRKLMLARYGRMLGYKVIMHCHGAEFDTFANEKGFTKIGDILNGFDRCVVLSSQWEQFLKEELKACRVNVINNPTSEPSLSRVKDPNVTSFLFLGEIGGRKGVFDLLKAYKKIAIPGKTMLHIGGNGQIDLLRREISALDLISLVKFHGWVTGAEKQRLISQCDVFVLPSYAEGLPMTILETMAACMPVISTPVGGIPTIVQPGVNGILVSPGDIGALAEAMSAYIQNPSLVDTQGAQSRKLVSPFLPANVRSQLLTMYRDLL